MQNNQSVAVETSARTWGAVKQESSRVRELLGTGDVKLVIKQTKAVIDIDDTVLPEGDLTIYIFPGKVKAGEQDFNFQEFFKEVSVPITAGFEAALKADLRTAKVQIDALVIDAAPSSNGPSNKASYFQVKAADSTNW